MKFEFSSGGIVYKRERTLKKTGSRKNAKNVYILVCQHSQHHGWVFPKGLIGDHPTSCSGQVETKEEAAIREVKEETGADAKIIKPLEPVTYWYVFEKEKIKKTVYYYIMEYVSGDIKDHDWEMENVEWLEPDKVEERLTYKSDKEAWRVVKELLFHC